MIDRRPVAIDAALIVGVAVASWIWHPAAARLGVPATCPGLVDAMAVGVARAWPTEALGPLLQYIDRAAFAVAMAAIVLAGRSLTSRRLVPVLVVAAMAAVPAFDSTYGLPSGVALATAAMMLAGLLAMPRVICRVSGLPLGMAAAISPALLVPLTIAAGTFTFGLSTSDARSVRRRAAEGLISAALVVFLTIAALSAVPAVGGAGGVHLWTCTLGPATARADALLDVVHRTLASTGPYVVALAALGGYALRRRLGTSVALAVAALAMAPLLAAAIAPLDVALVVAPTVVAIWVVAIAGLDELVSGLDRVGARIAALILLLLVPWLSWSARGTYVSSAEAPKGHEMLSLQSFERALTALPNHSALVQEDTVSSVLLRASRVRGSIEIVSLDRSAIDRASAGNGGHVYALPLAQQALKNMAYVVDGIATPGLTGIAHVSPYGKCAGVSAKWTDLSDVATSSALALFARTEDEAGPVVVYVGSPDSSAPRPVEWPTDALKGFNASVYDDTPDHRGQLRAIAEEDGLPLDWPGRTASSVTRLEMWRRPGAPLHLQIALGARPMQVIAQLVRVQPAARLLICTANPHDVGPIRVLGLR